MGNVLSDEKKQQILALGRLGWPLRRIEEETGVRRETSSRYLRAAGIAIRPAGQWGHAKAAKEVISDLGGGLGRRRDRGDRAGGKSGQRGDHRPAAGGVLALPEISGSEYVRAAP